MLRRAATLIMSSSQHIPSQLPAKAVHARGWSGLLMTGSAMPHLPQACRTLFFGGHICQLRLWEHSQQQRGRQGCPSGLLESIEYQLCSQELHHPLVWGEQFQRSPADTVATHHAPFATHKLSRELQSQTSSPRAVLAWQTLVFRHLWIFDLLVKRFEERGNFWPDITRSQSFAMHLWSSQGACNWFETF